VWKATEGLFIKYSTLWQHKCESLTIVFFTGERKICSITCDFFVLGFWLDLNIEMTLFFIWSKQWLITNYNWRKYLKGTKIFKKSGSWPFEDPIRNRELCLINFNKGEDDEGCLKFCNILKWSAKCIRKATEGLFIKYSTF
jgi:hypothetical protein